MKAFGFFYYSKKQSDALDFFGANSRNFARQIFTGKIVEYTEWRNSFPFQSTSKLGDSKLVAIGWYDHSEPRNNVLLTGEDAKEFLRHYTS